MRLDKPRPTDLNRTRHVAATVGSNNQGTRRLEFCPRKTILREKKLTACCCMSSSHIKSSVRRFCIRRSSRNYFFSCKGETIHAATVSEVLYIESGVSHTSLSHKILVSCVGVQECKQSRICFNVCSSQKASGQVEQRSETRPSYRTTHIQQGRQWDPNV